MPLLIEIRAFACRRQSSRPAHPARRDRGTAFDGCASPWSTTCPTRRWAPTERQFAELISEASGGFDVRLTLAALQTIPRAEETRATMGENYRRLEELRSRRARRRHHHRRRTALARSRQRAYWGELTALMEWTRRAVVSALYSCLAAHAAALHRDGIRAPAPAAKAFRRLPQ